MAYQEEERTRLRRLSSKQAIALAMQGRWRETVAANLSLLERFPDDVDAYNRLGRAYMELGEYAQAKEAYTKALELDSYNAIAKKNLHRLSHLGEVVQGAEGGAAKVEPQQFIEEVGRAGVVSLYRLAPPEMLARMVAGDRVSLRVDRANLMAENSRGEYLGQVDPKHGQHLIKLMEGGNRYTAAVINITEKAVTIIIREVYQHPTQVGHPSFPARGSESLRSYVDDRVGTRIIRRELEYEEVLAEGSDYTIVGGDEADLVTEESADADEEGDTEE